MKRLPLFVQIWLVFAAITLSISVLLYILLPVTLRSFFTREIYATIESAQTLMFNRLNFEQNREVWESGKIFDNWPTQDIRTVNHLILSTKSGRIIAPDMPFPILKQEISNLDENEHVKIRGGHSPKLPIEGLNEIIQQVKGQTENSSRYSRILGDRKIFYVATKGSVMGEEIFLISFMWDTYREDMVATLFKSLVQIMGAVILLSWLPALGLARYLTRPLVVLEKQVKRLADRDWQEPIYLQREDEIGRLGKSVEQLRKHLILQDEAQQTLLQNISHELKTPVMVIQSYIQAIKDGIYPKGDLNKTLQVLEEESSRLQKLVNNLLYLTKLDYFTTHNFKKEVFQIDKLIKDVVERLRWNRKELDWMLKLPPFEIYGDREQWRVVFENLLDNQIRYAHSKINITLTLKDDSTAILHIYNDGPNIEPELMKNIFRKYNKGYKGKAGLGLAIAHRIISLHGGKIQVKNEPKGVSFFLYLVK